MFRSIILACLLVCFAGAAYADPRPLGVPHHPRPAETSDRESFSFSGKVTKVDYAANVVEIASSGRHVIVVVEPTTSIDIAGEPGSVSDIRPGVKLRVEGIVRHGTFIAQTITIRDGVKNKKRGKP